MGREQHILLAVLGLLAGAFLGILSIKLLSPRPPSGAGVDIHDAVAISTAADIVEPPTLAIPAAAASAVANDLSGESPPYDAEAAAAEPMNMVASERYPARASSFSAPVLDAPPPADDVITDPAHEPSLRPSDPFAATERFSSPPVVMREPQRLDSDMAASAQPLHALERAEPAAATAAAYEPAAVSQAPRHEVTQHVATTGDSWWSLAERMYGDGRYYRALFAWNRAVNPRVSLVPGTPLELPPLSKLVVAWPALVPDE